MRGPARRPTCDFLVWDGGRESNQCGKPALYAGWMREWERDRLLCERHKGMHEFLRPDTTRPLEKGER